MRKEHFLVIILLFLLHSTFAANPFIKNYTIEDGLPTNKIIYSYQDSKGFIWFASDAGVVRFDGTNFKNYSDEEGMSDNIVMRIKEDSKGRVWFMNMNGTLNYFYKNTIYNEKNDTLLGQLKANFYFLNFYEDSDSSLYFYNTISDINILNRNNEVTRINFRASNQRHINLLHINKTSNNKFLLWSVTGIYEFYNIGDSAFLNPLPTPIQRAFDFEKDKTITFERTGFANIYKGSNIINKDFLPVPSEYINSLTVDLDGMVWLATYDKGIFCYNRENIVFHLNIDKAQGITVDKENNIWVTSASTGIYKINHEILNYHYWGAENFENRGIKSLAPSNTGKLWATNGKSLLLINGDEFARMNLDLEENNLSNLYQFEDNTLIISAIGGDMHAIRNVVYNEKTNTINFGEHKKLSYKVKKIAVKPDESTVYSFMNNQLLTIDCKNNLECFVAGLRIGRINNVFLNKDDNLVLNADKNYLAIDDQFRLNLPLQPYNGKTITSHLTIDDKYEIYNIIGNQLILKDDEDLYDLTEYLKSQIDYRIKGMTYNKNILFFYTTKTVYFIENPLKILVDDPLEINRLDIEFNNVNDIICNNNRLYIGSDDGLMSIPIEDCVNAKTQTPQPYFYNVSVDENEIDLNNNPVKLKSTQRLSINFASLNFSSTPSNYSYMLEGNENRWIIGNNSQVTYLNLAPGNYTFHLKARKGMEEFSNAISLPVVVQPTFFQRIITKIVILALLLGFLFLIFWSFYRRKLHQKETDNMIITLEHKALQSMMNPHFIFNALGSIQRYLLLNKAEEAGIYLSQFARLIRQNMNSLKSNSIQIDDEVERLRNYIELEQFRMSNKFDYQIEIEDKVDADEIAIPSMIIQPFVENAIWHGVSSLTENGKIRVHIKFRDEKSLEILVEDNGVGIQKSKPFSKSDQNLNMGVALTKKRLQLIGERYNVQSEITTEELNPGLDYPGTRVKMIVPIIN